MVNLSIDNFVPSKSTLKERKRKEKNRDGAYTGVNEFDSTKQSGNIRVLLSHVGLVRPNPTVQPCHQIHIVGYPSP